MSDRTRITFEIDPTLRDSLDEIAKFVRVSRSSLIRMVLYNALRE